MICSSPPKDADEILTILGLLGVLGQNKKEGESFYRVGYAFFLVAVVFAADICVFALVPVSAPAKVMGTAAVGALYHTR